MPTRALLPAIRMWIVGTNKLPILDYTSFPCMIVDDGDLIDRIEFPKKTICFDPKQHSFNPLKHLTWPKKLEFLSVINAMFPQGQDTLTKGQADTFILDALEHATRIDSIAVRAKTKDTGHLEAYRKLHTLLLSPVLKAVLTNQNPTALKDFSRTIVVRLNRAEMGDRDCFALANFLIAQYQGQVFVTDYGFYAHQGHAALIHQNRLTAQVNFLDELPVTIKNLLLLGQKIPSHCLPQDAELLALFAGKRKGSQGFTDYVLDAIE